MSSAQCEQALRNIEAALAEAGASMRDMVRVRYMLPNREDFAPCWPALRQAFGEVRPAATMIVAGLADPRMKIEIEVTARLSRDTAQGGERPQRQRSRSSEMSETGKQ